MEAAARHDAARVAGVRRYGQAEIYRHLHAAGNDSYGFDLVSAAIAAVGDTLGRPVDSLRQAAE